MNRTGLSIQEQEFSEIYSWLSYFTRHYDNAEREVAIVLKGIVEAYIQEHKRLDGKNMGYEDAVAILSTPPANPRKAGRHSRITNEQKAQMIEQLARNKTQEEIAESFQCSRSYVSKLKHGIIK